MYHCLKSFTIIVNFLQLRFFYFCFKRGYIKTLNVLQNFLFYFYT